MRIEHTITFDGGEIADIAFTPRHYSISVFATEVAVGVRIDASGRPYAYRVDVSAVKAKQDGTPSRVALAPIWYLTDMVAYLPPHIADLAAQAVDRIGELMRGAP
jgi:hypothetical protein